MRRFLANGGSIVPVTDFSSDELSKIYLKLMNIRWKDKYKDNCVKELADFIEAIRPMIFGSVLMFNDTPCAYDLVYKAECSDWIYFDDHNGGVDTNIKNLALEAFYYHVTLVTRGHCAKPKARNVYSVLVDQMINGHIKTMGS